MPVKAARLFDGKSRALIQNGVVVVQGDKIVCPVRTSRFRRMRSDRSRRRHAITWIHGCAYAYHAGLYELPGDAFAERCKFRHRQGYSGFGGARHSRAGFTTDGNVGARTYRTHDCIDVSSARMRLRKGIVVDRACFVATYASARPGDISTTRPDFATGFSDRNRT